jgi:large repetitive protein
MIRAFRFRSTGVSGRVLGIAILVAVLFVAGCTTNSAPPSPAPAITSPNTSGSAFMMGAAGTFTVTATGTPVPTFTETGSLPSGLTFNASTGTISGTPTGPAGSSTITITAHNGAGPDAVQTFTIIVNQPPAITSVNTTILTVGAAGTFTVTATGFPAPTFSETGALPSGVTLAAVTGILSGTPAASTGGTYPITIKAHNGAGADATQSFTLTVDQVSAITSANTTTFTVNAAGTFTVLATGFPAPTLSETGALPSGVTFTPATGKLSGTPAAGTAGTYPITFTAHNGIGADATQIFSLVVNQAPAITSASSAAFTVASAGTFTVTATGSPAPSFSETGSLPSGVTFNTTTGVLSGTPGAGTGGSYPIVFTALNGAGANATQNFTLTVNQASAITSANNTSLIVNAAGTFTVTATGFPAPTLSEAGTLPSGVTFTPATGKLSGTPATGTSGTYPITFTAHNGIGADATQIFTLTVDQAAAITSANSTIFAVGSVGTFTVTATGVPAPTLSETGALPAGVTFNTSTGILSGTAGPATGGTYPISFTAHNGVGADAVQSFTLTVNQAPVITSANTVTFVVGTAGTFTVTSTGPPSPTLSEAGALPSGVTFNASTGVLSGTPGPGTSGSYPITFTAHNVVSPDAIQSFTLKVNQAPSITSASSTTFTVATPGTFTVTATGLPAPTFTETGSLPTGVTFNTTTGVLSGTPGSGTGGVYPISFTALNGVGTNAAQNFTLTVNQAPAFTSANTTTFAVNSLGTFAVISTGPPAPSLVESGPLPSGVTFTDNGNGTGTLSGTSTVQGTFPISFAAHNGIGVDAVQSFTLTVNQAPAFSSVNNTTFTVGAAGTFTVTAGGVPAPTLSESGTLPTGVTFTPATGVLGGTPGAGTGGSYPITFTAHNSSGPDATQSFTLTVDQAAAVTSANNVTFTVGAPGTFTITTTGLPKPTLGKTGTLPGGVTFTDNLNGTATLAGTPAGGSVGSYPLTITAHNGVGTDGTQSFTLTVNQAPVITSANSTTFTVGAAGTFTLTATGAPAPTLSETGTLPTGVTFTPATGVLSGTPGAGTGGAYPITFTAHNASGPDATQNFNLTVNQSAAITSANSTSFVLNALGSFSVTATGFPTPTLSESGTLPSGVTFNTATGVLSGTPTASGTFPITFTAHNGVGADATQSFALTIAIGPPTVGTSVPFPIFAGDPATPIAITVTSDAAGDALTANLTVDSNTGAACTPATCGTIGAVSGTSGSGNYTVSYTPPASLAAQVVPTLVVSSSLTGSFAATDFIEVDPAGVPLVTLSGVGGGGIAQVGSAQRTLTATVYNDVTHAGVTFAPLTASGYTCSNLNTNSCGTLTVPSAPVTSGNTTTTTITYTPPPALPSAPYDRPRIQATSVASPTQLASRAFLLSNNPLSNTGLTIPINEKFNSALASPSAAAITVDANIGNDTGNSRTINWTLTASGANCSPTCGTLGTPVGTGNGTGVSSAVTYTPPASVPGVAADVNPTITATSVDNPSATDSFTFSIVDGTCSSTNNSVLHGQYAFLLRGGGAGGYGALIGSFTADGAGNITGGLVDVNRSVGPVTGLTITAAGSSYKVGSDNRVCLTLADSGGGIGTYRASLGTIVAGVATEGRIVRFDDNTGRGPRQSGVLMKQDPTSFNAAAFSGTYAFGLVGVDSNGGRNAGAGVFTANGAGTLSNLSEDFDNVGGASGVLTGSGSSTMAANGRGTSTVTINVSGGTATSHSVLYTVSSSEILIMTTDSLASNTPILSGEVKKQTGPFTQTSLDGNSYVFSFVGLNNSDGTNEATLGHFIFTTNGNATGVIDDNGNPEQAVAGTFTIASNGRVILSSGGGSHPPIFYLVNSSLAFVVDTGGSVASGFLEKQTGGPFSTASISGPYFFGAEAPTTGSSYSSGTANFNAATGVITGNEDSSRSDGLKANDPISNNGTAVTYCFATSTCTPATTAAGQGNVGGSLAYIISPSKIIFVDTSNQGGTSQNRIFLVIQK